MKNKFKIIGKYVEIYINSKYGDIKTIIDIEDLPLMNKYKNSWCINYKNNRIDGVRMKIMVNGKRTQIWLHRVIMDCPENKVIDHRNGNVLDNRKNNLRIVSKTENATNLSSTSKSMSKYKNIYIEKEGVYSVRINHKRFGRFKNIEEAVKCRNINMRNIFPLRERND